MDIERDGKRDDYLVNHTVQNFTWSNLSADAQLGRSKTQTILSEVDGLVSAGKGIRIDLQALRITVSQVKCWQSWARQEVVRLRF